MNRIPGRLGGRAFGGETVRSERGPSGRRRRGAILPVICLSLVALLGLMALSIDLGHLSNIKANIQNATDAAALAAAGSMTTARTAQDAAALCYLANRNQGTVQPSGSGTTSRTYTVAGDTVVATTPYSDATTTAQGWAASNLIEVRATRTVPLLFAPAVGVPSATVVSRSVGFAATASGGQWGVGEGCLFALNNGFALNCNNFTVKGSVYSNSSINMNLNNISIGVGDTLHAETSVTINSNDINGGFVLQYGTTYTINCNKNSIASYTKTPQTPVTPPITFVPANYASDFSIDYTYSSGLNVTGNTYTFAPGTYYINGPLSISANNVIMTGCTFIVNGNFTCNSNNVTMTPDSNGLKAGGTNYMCIYELGTGTISLNQNNITVDGDLYAPNGTISCNSNNINEGYWVANQVAVNCNNFELDGIPGRGGVITPTLVE